MKNIERIIESQYPPRQTNVAWKDVNENTLKFYVDGEWKALKDEDFRQKQADWNQADNTKEDFIKNKPTIPAAQIQSDWSQTDDTAADYIKNKPTIPSGGVLIVRGTLSSSGFVRNEGEPETADLVEDILSGKTVFFSADNYLYSLGGIYYSDDTPYIWLLADNGDTLEKLDFNDS